MTLKNHSPGNKTVLITGATDGLGKFVALELASKGFCVLIHGRNEVKGEKVLNELKDASGNDNLEYYNADLSSLEKVRELAGRVKNVHNTIDILINNAGIGDGSNKYQREVSTDGYELRFAVNYLSHFLLTHMLLPELKRAAPSRIINVSSIGQQAIDFSNVMLEKGYDGLRAYMQSKLAQIMFTFDLAEKLKNKGVTVNCLHPSTLMNTNMVFESASFPSTMSKIEDGVEAVMYLAITPELDNVTGEYFDRMDKARANTQAYDKNARKKLWGLSEKLTYLK